MSYKYITKNKIKKYLYEKEKVIDKISITKFDLLNNKTIIGVEIFSYTNNKGSFKYIFLDRFEKYILTNNINNYMKNDS